MDLDGINNMIYTINLDDWSRISSVEALGKTIVSYSYDDALGLITAKKHYAINDNSKVADEITYAYDDRNRLTSINSALFDWYMYYDNNHPQLDTDPFKVNSDENYNGNINATKAVYKLDQTNLGALPGNLFKGETVYGYQYDGLNRLINADATVMDNFITGGLNDESMKVYGDVSFTYDNIGNITSLNRNHFSNELAATSDQWIYTYEPAKNKLLSVNGSSSRNYTYDLSGNLLTDDFRSLDNTVYGRANLPTLLTKADESILYGYDINDDRMYVRVDSLTTTKSREYYIKDVSGRTLAVYDLLQDKRQWYGFGKDRVAELKVNENSTSSTLVGISYFVQDHLGNTRVKYIPTYNTATMEVDYYVENVIDFFPYGKVLREYNPASDARYVSTHHERDDETGFDYRGARFYDSDVARFLSLDPLAAEYPSYSDYVYVAGNPLIFVDKTGKYNEFYNTSGVRPRAGFYITNYKWIEDISYKRAIPIIGLVAEAGYWLHIMTDPSWEAGEQDYESLMLNVIGVSSLKIIKKLSKVKGLGAVILEVNRETLNSIINLMSDPSTFGIGIDMLAVESFVNEGIGTFRKGSKEESSSVFTFTDEFLKTLTNQILEDKEITSQDGFSLEDEIEKRISKLMDDKRNEIIEILQINDEENGAEE